MNLHPVLATVEREKILRHVIMKTGHITVNETARELKISKALVSIYFSILGREGIMGRSGNRFFIKDSIQTKAVKILLNVSTFETGVFRKYGFVRGAGLYGSVVKGTNTEDSDIDMWIVVDPAEEEKIAGMIANLRKKYGNVKPIVLTHDKAVALKERDPLFYHALAFGSIVIYGEGLEGT